MIIVTSDVHLRPDRPERTDRFVRFLGSVTRSGVVEAIYLLGDLFDFWIGPRHPRGPYIETALGALEGAGRAGVEVSFLPGNRDFHLGAEVLGRIGVRLLGDVHCLQTAAGRVLLAHGDQLCTRDAAYRMTRAAIRSLPARIAWRALPPRLALNLAAGLRSVSVRSVRKKPEGVREVSAKGIRRAIRSGVDVIVCGHVHRQGHRRVEVDGRGADLYTLADWERGEPHLIIDGSDIVFGDANHDGE